MLMVINRESVLVNSLMWARMRLSQVLRVDPDHIDAKWTKVGDRIVPRFEIADSELADEVGTELVREVIQTVAGQMREMIAERFEGLSQRRA